MTQSTTKSVVITTTDFERLRTITAMKGLSARHGGPIGTLKSELARGTVVSPHEVPDDVVTMRSQVRVRDAKTNSSDTYTLVYPEEANIDTNRISVLAPLGIALIGTRVGQKIQFDTPSGKRQLIVEAVQYQPESEGEFHL